MSQRKALIIMGHGSRRASANDEFSGYAKQVATMDAALAVPRYQHIDVAFLEFSPQTLSQACERALKEGCNCVDIYPVFLTLGKHVGHDIPQQIADITVHLPGLSANLLGHMGTAPGLPSLISEHLTQQLDDL